MTDLLYLSTVPQNSSSLVFVLRIVNVLKQMTQTQKMKYKQT